MAGPTTEQLNEDLRSVRDDVSTIRRTTNDHSVRLAEIGTKLGDLDGIKGDLKAVTKQLQDLAVNTASLTSRVNAITAISALLVSVFGLALIGGLIGGASRLSALEAEVNTSIRSIERSLAEMRESISRHQTDPVPDLDERINRAVKSSVDVAVDAAVKRASLPRPPQ